MTKKRKSNYFMKIIGEYSYSHYSLLHIIVGLTFNFTNCQIVFYSNKGANPIQLSTTFIVAVGCCSSHTLD